MAKLASILPITSMLECQEFINRVSELRLLKVKQIQINKFNRLLIKEGNITWSQAGSTLSPAASTDQAGSTLPPAASTSSQADRASQAVSAHPPTASTSSQAVSTSHQTVNASPR